MDPPPSHSPLDPFAGLPWNRHALGLESRLIRAGLRTDFDIGRAYMVTSAATLVGAGSAIYGAIEGDDLCASERVLAGVTGATYAGLGVLGLVAAPSQIAFWFQRRPKRALVAASLPLPLVVVTGGVRSPLLRLGTVGVMAGASVRAIGRDAQLHGVAAGLVYAAACFVSPGPPQLRKSDVAATTVGFWLAGRIGGVASQVAYDSRNLFDQLVEFTYERRDLDTYAERLADSLTSTRQALLEAVRTEPSARHDKDELFRMVVTSLGRLEERSGVLSVATSRRFSLPEVVRSMSPWPRGGRSTDQPSVAPVGSVTLEELLKARARLFTDLDDALPTPVVDVAPDVEVQGLPRLALIAATVTGATANAVRHTRADMSSLRVSVRQDEGWLVLTIVNDGAGEAARTAPQRSSSGLLHLEKKLADLRGQLLHGHAEGGQYIVEARLPGADTDRIEFWAADIRGQIESTITSGALLAAVKSTILALSARTGDHRSNRRPPTGVYAHALLPLLAEAGVTRIPARLGGAFHAGVLMAAAAGNHYGARSGYGLTTTWVNGFAARYAFGTAEDRPKTATQHFAVALALLNAAAAYPVRRSRRRAWPEAFASATLGSLLVQWLVNPAQPRMTAIDIYATDRLDEVESLHELADSFDNEHAAEPKILEVAEAVADPELRIRLLECLEDINVVERALEAPEDHAPIPALRSGEPLEWIGDRLKHQRSPVRDHPLINHIWPEPESYHTQSVGVPDEVRVGEYLANALSRRVWPARVMLTFDDAVLDFAPAPALESAKFRRKAVMAMDIIGRAINWEFGRRADGLWALGQVDLGISILPLTGTIECKVTAWAPRPTRARRAVDALHNFVGRTPLDPLFRPRDGDLADRLEQVGASLVEGWQVYPEHKILPEPRIYLRTNRPGHPHVRRAEAVVHLHPQRYAQRHVVPRPDCPENQFTAPSQGSISQ